MKKCNPPVVAISGIKNSGKTTLIEGLVSKLSARGMRIAVVKHDGHSFVPDVPGTDSYRHRAAGACGVAVFSNQCYMTIKNETVAISDLIDQFSEMDLVLLEGMKSSRYPKIEVVRGEKASGPVCDPATTIALVTDLPLHITGKPCYGLDDLEGIAGFLQHYITDGGIEL